MSDCDDNATCGRLHTTTSASPIKLGSPLEVDKAKDLYKPGASYFGDKYRTAVGELSNPANSLGDKAVYGAFALGTAIPAFFNDATATLYNTPNEIYKGGQDLAVGVATKDVYRFSQGLGGASNGVLILASTAAGLPQGPKVPLPGGSKGTPSIGKNQVGAVGPVKPGQKGTYGELKEQKAKFGETELLDMDHQPSFASQVAARESALGRTLTPAERATVKSSTPAVASPRTVHQQTSPTYGGRNTPSRIAGDAADPNAAAARDRAAFNEAMRKRENQ